MNKYHNRNRIFSPIMTIHDILTLHNKNSLSFFPFLSFFFFSPSLFPPSLFPPLSLFPFSFLSLPLFPFFFIFPLFPLSLSVFSVFYREGRRLFHHPDVERYCARLSE